MPSDSSHSSQGPATQSVNGYEWDMGAMRTDRTPWRDTSAEKSARSLGRRVGDELGNEPGLPGDHLHQQRVAVDGVEVLRKGGVGEGAFDPAVVHSLQQPLRGV